MIRIYNPTHSSEIYLQTLFNRFLGSRYQCVPLLYKDALVVLASDKEATLLLNTVLDSVQDQFSQVCISLPFEDLQLFKLLYDQTCYISGLAGDRPGLYRGDNYSFHQLLSTLREDKRIRVLIHPALAELKRYDEAKHSNLYETMYQYLLHEHSIQLGADAMHVHKNTFSYRLDRAREIVGIDIESPLPRLYLLLSYLIDGCGM